MTELEILDAYQAMDFARLTLYLMGRMALCDNTEIAVQKELNAFMNLINSHDLGWCFAVDPISVLSLVEHCMSLLNEHKLPGNLLELDEITARNTIFPTGVLPFIQTMTHAIMDSLSGRPVMSDWGKNTAEGVITQQQAFLVNQHEHCSVFTKSIMELLNKQLSNHPSEKSIIQTLLHLEATGVLSPDFCRERWIALDAAIKQARHECETYPDRDTCQDKPNKHRPTDAHLDGAGYPGAVGFSVN